jgi:hypothetical protein
LLAKHAFRRPEAEEALMFECLILGDSTGVGTAQAINARYERHCDVQAAERATAAQVLSWRPGKRYDTHLLDGLQ